MPVNLDALLISIVVHVIFGALVLWLVGRAIVSGEKAKFTDAIWIAALGVVVGTFFGAYFTGIIASIIQFVIWLMLVRHFFDASWGQALIIAIVNVIVWIIIGFVLGLIGFAVINWI